MLEYLKDVFHRTIPVAVFVTKEDYSVFQKVLEKVKNYKVDRLRNGDDVIFAFKLKENRYKILVRECYKHDIPLVAYSEVKYLHRIVK